MKPLDNDLDYLHETLGPVELIANNLVLFVEIVEELVEIGNASIDELARLLSRLLDEPVVAEQHQDLVRVHKSTGHEADTRHGHHYLIAQLVRQCLETCAQC